MTNANGPGVPTYVNDPGAPMTLEDLGIIEDHPQLMDVLPLVAEVRRLRLANDDYEHVGWGLRSHPDAPCEWYLVPLIDTTKPRNTGSNKPPQPPWEKVFVAR